jgi:hypothetical protein
VHRGNEYLSYGRAPTQPPGFFKDASSKRCSTL